MEISEPLTIVGLQAATSEEAITTLAGLLLTRGCVRETFLQAVLEREHTMPTGLLTGAGGVAIPHTDTVHVLRSAIAVGLLGRPVVFKSMAMPKEDLPVDLILMLAIAEAESVTPTLARLAALFQAPDALAEILKQESAANLVFSLKAALGEAREPMSALDVGTSKRR